MEHLESIIWLISWPILVFASYFLANYGIKKFNTNKKMDEE